MSIRKHVYICVTTCLIFLAIMSVILSFTFQANAQQAEAEIKVINPDRGDNTFKFYTNDTDVGSKFNLTVYVYDVTDLFAHQVSLTVNDTLLTITRAWLPIWDPNYVFYGQSSVQPAPALYDRDHDNASEAVKIGDSLLTGTPFTGSGLLVIIELEVIIGPGENQKFSCALSIDNDDTFILSSNLDEIPVTKTDGFYEYVWAGELPYVAIEPKSYVAEKLEDVNFSVWIKRVSPDLKLKNITLKITYNSRLLEVKNVVEGDFLKEIGESVFNWTVSNGYLTIINYLKQEYANASEGIVATITFTGIYQDYTDRVSSITFTDVKLIDIYGNLIKLAESQSALYTIKGQTQIVIRLDRDTAYVGSDVTISGWIIPPKEGIEVTIRYRSQNVSSWREVYVETDENGNYSYCWKVPSEVTMEAEYYYFKAVFYVDSLEVESEEVSLRIERKETTSSLSIEVIPADTVLVGEDVTIRGELSPTREGVNITIQFRFKGETEWEMLAIIKTDSRGSFTFVWPAPKIGDYEVRAYWSGDEETEAAYSNIVSISIVETMSGGLAGFSFIIVGIIIVIIMFFLAVYFKSSEYVS